MRRKLYQLLMRLFNVEEGEIIPWYLYFIAICFFPYCYFKSKFDCYDFRRDCYIIEGLRISPVFFQTLEVPTPEGVAFRIVSNRNGVVTVERVRV